MVTKEGAPTAINLFSLSAIVFFAEMRIIFSLFFFISSVYQMSASQINFEGNVLGNPVEHVQLDYWVLWKRLHKKRYSPGEDRRRFIIWVSNFYKSNVHNVRFAEGRETYLKGLNKFSEKGPDEVEQLLHTGKRLFGADRESVTLATSDTVPDNLNWALRGWAWPSKSRIVTSGGWIYSAVEAVQAQIYNVSGHRTKLSDKEILDCAKIHNGGQSFISSDAFFYILTNGVTYNSFYPSKFPRRSWCKRNDLYPRIHISDYHLLEVGNEENLKLAVAFIGPVSANIWVTANFFFYKSGVFYDPGCQSGAIKTNHAVLVVGYGNDHLAGDFWIIQNSWGQHWGEDGFARMSRNTVANCGIASAAFYPVI